MGDWENLKGAMKIKTALIDHSHILNASSNQGRGRGTQKRMKN
jgi:hypothetical protein